MQNATENNTFMIATGSVQYSIDEAAQPIEDIIDMLREAQKMGAEYVVLDSGNYRGDRYQTIYGEGDIVSEMDI